MSNRFQERIAKLLLSGPGGPVNLVQWGSAVVHAAVVLADAMSNADVVPEIGSRIMAYNSTDGWNRVRIGTVASGLFDLKIGGIETPRSVQLASAALPAAGAFTNQAAYAIPSGIGEISYWLTYTRGAMGGFAYAVPLWGNGTEEGHEIILDQSSLTTAQPVGNVRVLEQQIECPHPADGNPIVIVLAFRVPRGATTGRLLLAEGGAVGTPGTAALTLAGGTAR